MQEGNKTLSSEKKHEQKHYKKLSEELSFCQTYIKNSIEVLSKSQVKAMNGEMTWKEFELIRESLMPSIALTQRRKINLFEKLNLMEC